MSTPSDHGGRARHGDERRHRVGAPDGGPDSVLAVAHRDIAALRRSPLLWVAAALLLVLHVQTAHSWMREGFLVQTPYELLTRLPSFYYSTVGLVAAATLFAANGGAPATGLAGRIHDRLAGVRRAAGASPRRRAATGVAVAALVAGAYLALLRTHLGMNMGVLYAVGAALVVLVALGDNPARGDASGPGGRSGGLPARGRTGFLGVLVSRTTALLALFVGTFLLQALVVVVELRAFEPAAFLAQGGLIVLFVAMWAAIAVGFGAFAATPKRAVGATFGLYVLANATHFWHNTVSAALGALALGDAFDPHALTQLHNPPTSTPDWALYLGWFNPFDGFRGSSNWVGVEFSSTHFYLGEEVVDDVVTGGDPIHVAYGVGVMVLWAAAFLAVGYYAAGRSRGA